MVMKVEHKSVFYTPATFICSLLREPSFGKMCHSEVQYLVQRGASVGPAHLKSSCM